MSIGGTIIGFMAVSITKHQWLLLINVIMLKDFQHNNEFIGESRWKLF